jgi:hypothetical protein
MEKNPLNKGLLTENSIGIGPVSRAMTRQRASELALIAGRSEHEVSKADWEQAKQELAGAPAEDPNQAVLEAAPESARDTVPASSGHQVPDAPSEDEDEEGRSETAQLVDEGVNEAERDQRVQAACAAGKGDALES